MEVNSIKILIESLRYCNFSLQKDILRVLVICLEMFPENEYYEKLLVNANKALIKDKNEVAKCCLLVWVQLKNCLKQCGTIVCYQEIG